MINTLISLNLTNIAKIISAIFIGYIYLINLKIYKLMKSTTLKNTAQLTTYSPLKKEELCNCNSPDSFTDYH